MSYVPTIEDLAHLVETEPDKFSSPVQTMRSMRDALHNGNDNVGQIMQELTVQPHYRDYLANGGQPLTGSPIPQEPADTGGRQDPILGSACVECESQTPCIEKVVVVCHSGENTRVTLQGEGELHDTEGKIYFVADRFVAGEASFENFLSGTPLKDEGTLTVTLAGDCSHGQHTLSWTEELNGTSVALTETSIDFTVQTNPRPTLLNTDIFEPPHLAYEVVAITLDILMNRAIMVKEETFTISLDSAGCFSFTSVTVPQLKFIGSVSLDPPRRGERAIGRSEARELRNEHDMNSNPRQEILETGWGVAAALSVVCGNNTKRIDIGSINSETRTYESAPSLRRQERERRESNGVQRFMGAITNASKGLAQRLCSERDESKLVNLYTVGPRLGLELGTEQAEEKGGPDLTWMLTAGVSVDFVFGVNVNIYEALKRAARMAGHPAGRALVAFLEDAEGGRNWGVAEYQINPALFIDVSIGIGSQSTEDTTGNANLSARYDFMKNEMEGDGHITGTLRAVVGGGVSGFFDSIVTDRRVFKYEATVSTSGRITIKVDDNKRWGYELAHGGAMLRVIGYKKVNVEEAGKRQDSGGESRSSRVTQTSQTVEWVEDRENINTYRLAEGYTGEFVPFS
ncbi:hypothetical protein [Billgrantia bachuensis]|uniref:Uncharacterized protein n=1 Tax=Billgrantia bachuensis TaxID=2717286 RepID=A0ABX0PQR3_9GAMM|nr:hypothetical protein [Halomonas bachuensis]NIC04885.1 hypothetical protein [Halomonas bachuensis]